jgi:hypothetical protein
MPTEGRGRGWSGGRKGVGSREIRRASWVDRADVRGGWADASGIVNSVEIKI